jgi:hypothetical protein
MPRLDAASTPAIAVLPISRLIFMTELLRNHLQVRKIERFPESRVLLAPRGVVPVDAKNAPPASRKT